MIGASSIRLQAWIDAACARQDYLWFVGFITAVATVLAWWHSPRRGTPPWIGWAALAVGLQCGAAIAAFMTPYNERTNPGPTAPPPHLFSDLFMAGAMALLAGAWWWQLTETVRLKKTARWLGLILLAGVVWLRKGQPIAGGFALAGAMTLLVPFVAAKLSRWHKAGLVSLALAMWLAPYGPVAALQDGLQRWRGWTLLNLLCPLLLTTASLALLTGLCRSIIDSLSPERQKALRSLARPFLAGVAIWIVSGLALAAVAAHYSRQAFETSALHRVVTAAALFDARSLESALGPSFKPEPLRVFQSYDGRAVQHYRAESTGGTRVEPAMAQLRQLFGLNPDLTYARIALPYADDLMSVVLLRWAPGDAGRAYPLRPLTEVDREHWKLGRAHVDLSTTQNGPRFMARAPLRDSAGRVIAWLQFDYYIRLWASAQAQARLLTFVVVTLGIGMMALWFLRQWREHERQAALRTAAAAEEANRLKTTFLANVSHELRTPIQSVLGYAELLQTSLRGEAERARLAALRQHGELMIRLVNDLIDLATIESGAFRLVEKSFSLRELTSAVVESLTPRAEMKGLRLVYSIDPAVPHYVCSDPERLRQILINLVGNAVKYTERGRIDVSLSLIAEEQGFYLVELAVRDTGPGILPEDQAALFAPFSRLARTSRKEGAGLGLALAAGLCRRLGGELLLESDGSSGSLFRTRLRLAFGTAPLLQPAAAAGTLEGWRVLIADDNALIRELFVTYLRELGAQCWAVADGPSALASLESADPHALVLDLAMPGMDGHEVARRVRQLGGKHRIVGVSAHAGAAERAEALSAGMDEFLSKPIELAALANALRPESPPQPEDDFWLQQRGRWEDTLRQELPAELAQIAGAVAASDWDRLVRLSHHLRNSASVVRDDDLFYACGDLENSARAGDHADVSSAWARCQQAALRWTTAPDPFRSHPRPPQPKPSNQP